MERIKRIRQMEERLHRASAALSCLSTALDELPALRSDAAALSEYYEGTLWRADFEADEKGLLPQDLPRGVLSEDALYDFLTEYDAVMEKLHQALE